MRLRDGRGGGLERIARALWKLAHVFAALHTDQRVVVRARVQQIELGPALAVTESRVRGDDDDPSREMRRLNGNFLGRVANGLPLNARV